MKIKLERRAEPSRIMQYMSPLIAVGLTGVVGLCLFIGMGRNPASAFYVFTVQPIENLYGVGELLIKASPLILIALGLAIGFRANVWNIGAEGQLTIGVIFSGAVALHYGPQGGYWVLPAMLLAGAFGGIVWAAIPAFLRTRFNANEILTSLMLTYVAQLWLSYLIYGPWRDPAGFNFPQSEPLAPNAMLPILIDGTRLNAGVLITLAAAVLTWFILKRSFVGYQLQVSGLSEAAARYAGFKSSRAVWIGMLAGGVAAGVAGAGEIAGPLGQLFPTASPGYGFAAIIVAFLGRLQPVGIVLGGLLISLLYLSGEAAQMSLNLPSAITGLFQGVLLFFLLGADVLITYRVRVISETPVLKKVAA